MKIIIKKIKQVTIGSILTISVIIASNSFAANYIEDAKQYMDKGEYKAAIIQLKNRLKDEPDDAQARFLLGTSYLEIWDVKLADKEISRAYQLNPSSQKVVLIYAKLLLLKKKYNRVIEVLDKSFSDINDENQRQIYKAYAFMGQNKLADAKQILTELRNHYENEEVFNGLAKISLLENEMDIAEQWVDKSLKIKPENFDALQIKARIQNANNNLEEALSTYDNLIQKRKNNLKTYLKRAAIKFELGDLQGAEEDVQVVLAKINNQPHANYILARIKLKDKNYQESQEAAQNVLNIIPRHFESMLILGITNFYQGNYNQADKYLTQYISANPDSLVAHNILANVYMTQENGEQALLILESIDEEKRNNNANILTIMGSAYILTGEHQKGVNALNKAKALAPDSLAIQKRLISEQLRTGDIDNAIISLEKIADSKQSEQKINHLLIISYIQKKELDKAEAKLNDLLKKTSDDPVLYNLMATVEKLKGNKQRAKEEYNQAIQRNKKYIPAYFGLAELAMEEKNWASAKDYYSKVIQIKPAYMKTYTKLAAIAVKQNNPLEFEKQLKIGFEQADGYIKSQVYLANILSKWYLKQKTPEKIMPMAKKLNRKYPNNNTALSFLAAAQIANNKNEQAEQTLRFIINEINRDTKHRIMLAALLVKKKGGNSEALVVLDDAIRMNPDDPKPVSIKITYLINDKQYQKASVVAEYAKKQFPKLAFGYQLQGDVYSIEKRLDKALINYQNAYELQPSVKLLFTISELLNKQGKEQEALKLLEGELKDDDNKLVIHFKIANIYQKNRQFKLAARHYFKMMEIKKDNILALNNLAIIYEEEGNTEALSFARKAHEMAPDVVEIMDTYGYIQLKQGDITKGIKLLEKAVKLSPENKDIKYHLAEGYALNGEKTKAKELLTRLLNDDNNFFEKENAQALFNKL